MEQDDVLEKKGHVTKNARGLQIWGDEGVPTEGVGTGATGTAERAAKIAEGQKEQERKRPEAG